MAFRIGLSVVALGALAYFYMDHKKKTGKGVLDTAKTPETKHKPASLT